MIKKKRIHLTIQLFARMNIANCFDAALKRMRAFIFKMRKKVEEEEREGWEQTAPQQQSASKRKRCGDLQVVLVVHQFRPSYPRPSLPAPAASSDSSDSA